jgi:hypothetical protein
MPEKKTLERARRDEAEGKAPTTQAANSYEKRWSIFAKASTARVLRSRQ